MKVNFVGFGGFMEVPCYEDEKGRLYFDENNGRGGLSLYTGAYRDDCGEICGEPNKPVAEDVICDNPYKRDPREHDYMLLGRLKDDCNYFVSRGGGLRISSLWAAPKEMLSKMESILNSFSPEEMPLWFSRSDFLSLKREVVRVESANPVRRD